MLMGTAIVGMGKIASFNLFPQSPPLMGGDNSPLIMRDFYNHIPPVSKPIIVLS